MLDKVAMLALVATITETELFPPMVPLLAETESQVEVLMRLQATAPADRLVNSTAWEPGLNGPPTAPAAVKPLVVSSTSESEICKANWRY